MMNMTFAPFIAVMCVGSLLAELQTVAQAQEPVLIFKSSSDKKRDQYGVTQYRIPHITQDHQGQLIISVAGRTNTGGDNGRTTSVFATSNDGGKSWTPIRFESDYDKPTPEGEFPMSSRTNEVQVQWFPAIEAYVAIYATNGHCYQIRSKDLKTWGKPRLLPFQDKMQKSWPSPSSILLEDDGTLCFCLIAEHRTESFGDRSVQVYWTRDGEHFETSGPAPFHTGETSCAKVGNGKYLFIARAHQKSLNRLQFTYDRKTRTWNEMQSMTTPTYYRCQQDILHANGKVYLSVPNGGGRKGGVIYVTSDRGKTWDTYYKMPEDAYFGYSAMVDMGGGDIGLAFESGGIENVRDISFVRIAKQ
jgi:hypothetical protein